MLSATRGGRFNFVQRDTKPVTGPRSPVVRSARHTAARRDLTHHYPHVRLNAIGIRRGHVHAIIVLMDDPCRRGY
jgi:hypothetical protein